MTEYGTELLRRQLNGTYHERMGVLMATTAAITRSANHSERKAISISFASRGHGGFAQWPMKWFIVSAVVKHEKFVTDISILSRRSGQEPD